MADGTLKGLSPIRGGLSRIICGFQELPNMKGLTTELLQRACRIFLDRAYPEGPHTIPPASLRYLALDVEIPLEYVLIPPVCQPWTRCDSGLRGYALRLGSARHPHLKLQIVDHEDDGCVFSVETHDGFSLDSPHSEEARWRELQSANRRLKEEIERDWEAAGLLTFNGLLRRELARKA
jgi:hypothetical protein